MTTATDDWPNAWAVKAWGAPSLTSHGILMVQVLGALMGPSPRPVAVTHTDLAGRSGISERHVQRVLDRLRSTDWIETVRRGGRTVVYPRPYTAPIPTDEFTGWDALIAGCHPTCLLAQSDPNQCDCTCTGRWHGQLLDSPITDVLEDKR